MNNSDTYETIPLYVAFISKEITNITTLSRKNECQVNALRCLVVKNDEIYEQLIIYVHILFCLTYDIAMVIYRMFQQISSRGYPGWKRLAAGVKNVPRRGTFFYLS